MSIMTEDQVKLLHKLQMAEIPAFKNINPLTLWPAREGACLLANIAMQIEGYHTFW